MSAEAGFSVTVKDSKGNLLTLRGDTYHEFKTNLAEALGGPNAESFLNHYASAFTGVQSTAQAVGNVQAAFPQAAPVQPSATVGGNVVPMPQPGSVQPQGDQPPAALGGGGGNCAHGERVYKESQTKNGLWRRYECAIPWSRENGASRCKAQNV